MTAAAQLLDAVVPIVRTRLPRGVDIDYLDDFVDRNRLLLEAVIEQNLGPMLRRMEAANNASFVQEDIPEFWTAAKRTAANVAAMATAANLYAQKRAPTHDERAVLAGYSGWGGLSIEHAAGKLGTAASRQARMDEGRELRRVSAYSVDARSSSARSVAGIAMRLTASPRALARR